MADDTDRSRRDRDMVLAPNEFMYVSDETKGNVDVYAGPTKQSLSGTDQPVIFDTNEKRFKKADFIQAIQVAKTAPEGWYVVLKNPARDGKHPTGQTKMSSAELTIGRKVNIPGPVSFCLWPGQMAKVLKGHHLRSNQYLLVRVYDEEGARANWEKAVIKPATPGEPGTGTPDKPAKAGAKGIVKSATDLTMGKLIVIKGTDISFYIPPTGMEVVQDEEGELVREAVTLERLEYCLLMDENGNKRYERGPAVVFPEPTEVFVDRETKDGIKTRKFRAIELNENSGIYVKVIADYQEGGESGDAPGKSYRVGDELFITGKDQMIYFPREEHAIVKYDGSEIHYGIAIPAGEARYVLDRQNGNIAVVKGPNIFLPDPRKQVVVRRILDFKTCDLLFPNNHSAMEHNARLAGVDLSTYMEDSMPVAVAAVAAAAGGLDLIAEDAYSANLGAIGGTVKTRGLGGSAAKGFSGDAFQRKTKYTEPRTITLPTKFDGAVSVDIWTGYAMMLVRKSGERKVVRGPQTVLLEYDETPQVLTLSRGKPKSTDNLLRTGFLLTMANKVSDVVEVETHDFCRLQVKLSYRVHFEGDSNKWFDVENYVKFLCDHMRSRVRSAIQKIGIEEFYGNHTDILRDVILGKATDDATGKVQAQGRPGTTFKENGMRIYDVEVLGVSMQNQDVEKLLVSNQREVISGTLTLASERRKLELTIEQESILRRANEAKAETASKQLELKTNEAKQKLEFDLAILAGNAKTETQKLAAQKVAEEARSEISAIEVARGDVVENARIEILRKEQTIELATVQAEVQAVVDKAKAISPDLIAALNAFGERALVEKVSQAMAPLAILGGDSIGDVLGRLLKGTILEKVLLSAPISKGNGPSEARA